VNFLTAKKDCFLACSGMTVLSKAAAVLQPKSRCNFAARLFPLISCQIPLFGGTANFALDSNEINYFEASGWASDRPEWALFPAFSEEQGIRSLSSDRRRGKFW
jgi:hypothetical protein